MKECLKKSANIVLMEDQLALKKSILWQFHYYAKIVENGQIQINKYEKLGSLTHKVWKNGNFMMQRTFFASYTEHFCCTLLLLLLIHYNIYNMIHY